MLISVKKLLTQIVSPVECPPWEYSDFTKEDVILAYKNKEFADSYLGVQLRDTQFNIKRIAYFIKRMPIDPIQIDVGVPCVGYYPDNIIMDGWHRIYAAIIRKDKFIHAEISGQVDYIQHLFK